MPILAIVNYVYHTTYLEHEIKILPDAQSLREDSGDTTFFQ